MSNRSDCTKTKPPGQRNLLLSFDMAKFSQKFPKAVNKMRFKLLSKLLGCEFTAHFPFAVMYSVIATSTVDRQSALLFPDGSPEGWFNFGWTSTHAAVMGYALEVVNHRGGLSAYSDDGVLHIVIDDTMSDEEIVSLMEGIGLAFLRVGLNFHFGKTGVSSYMFEFLGDVAIRGKFCPQWVKELSTLSVAKMESGLVPPYLKAVSLLQSGVSAVSRGAYVGPVTILQVSKVISLISGLVANVSQEEMFLILCLTPGLGGCRAPSGVFASIQSHTSEAANCVASLMLLEEAGVVRSRDYIFGKMGSEGEVSKH